MVARRVERLVADLPGRSVVAEVDPAVDGDDPADPGPERQADHRSRPLTRPEPELGEPERASVVHEGDREVERGPDPGTDRLARPAAPHVDKEPSLAGRRVVQSGNADPDRDDLRPAFARSPRELDHAPNDRVRTFLRLSGELALPERLPLVVGVLHYRPFEVCRAKVDPEVVDRARGHDSPVTRV